MLEPEAERWLSIQKNLGRAPNTLVAYRRSLQCCGSFCLTLQRPVLEASKADVDLFIRSMTAFRLPASRKMKSERFGMANATIRLRLTAIRLFYDHLIEEGLRGQLRLDAGGIRRAAASAAPCPEPLFPTPPPYPGFRTMPSGDSYSRRPGLSRSATG